MAVKAFLIIVPLSLSKFALFGASCLLKLPGLSSVTGARAARRTSTHSAADGAEAGADCRTAPGIAGNCPDKGATGRASGGALKRAGRYGLARRRRIAIARRRLVIVLSMRRHGGGGERQSCCKH